MPISKIENSSIEDTAIHGARNLIINGNFSCWQRSTSGFTGSEYIADRWRQNLSGATATSSQQSFTIGQTSVPNNPEYYVNMNCTTGNNNAGLQQRIENPKRLSNTTITISFWAKGTNPSGGSFDLDVYAYDGSGLHFPTNRQQSFTVTSGWQKFVKSVTLSDLSGETFTSSGYTLIGFTQPDGDTGTAAWSLDLAQVQVELGEQATPFEHESYAATLQKCQRYFQKRVFTDADAIWVGANFNATSAYGVIEHIVTMRTEPSGAYSGTLADYKYYSAANTKTPTAMAINNRNSENSSETHIDWSGDLNSGGAGWLRAVGTNAFVQLEAEL